MKGLNTTLLSLLLFIFLIASLPLSAQVYNDYLGNGHDIDIKVTTSSQDGSATGSNTVSGAGRMPDEHSASRFLAHTTLGADYETIQDLVQKGFSEWMEEQFNEPTVSFVDEYDQMYADAYQAHIDRGEDPTEFGPWNFQRFMWWHQAMTGNDLLRDRIALALSEIFVVSERSAIVDYPEALLGFYGMLYENSFGNFRDLLEDVSLHPAMGFYLSHLNNPKSVPADNQFPDENYAREVMQLFSIGLYELNEDGSQKLDGNNNPIPTYDNEDIREFAKIFTGLGPAQWSVSALEEMAATNSNWGTIDFGACLWCTEMRLPMAMYEYQHEQGEKQLLNGQVVPAGQTGMQDIDDAIGNLFNHPNVGPFIGYRLIQRLVKSNPSPEYVTRVTAAFNDNGQGVRGDMKAVIRAILLDSEARDCGWLDVSSHGMLREPIVRYTHILRAFNVANNVGTFYNAAWNFDNVQGQHPLASPSVFNFFLPNYQPLGPINDVGLVAPEFQIFNSTTSLGYVNKVHHWTLWNWVFDTYDFNAPDQENLTDDYLHRLDFSDEEALANDVDALIDRLDVVLTHGNLSAETRQIVRDAVLEIGTDWWQYEDQRTRLAIYLIMISPDYAILK